MLYTLPSRLQLRWLNYCACRLMSQIGNNDGCSKKDSSIIAHDDSNVKRTSVKINVDVEERLKDWENAIDEKVLTSSENAVHRSHLTAVKSRQETYIDPSTGYIVFSIFGHLTRGFCCGRACRHCPYHHASASPNERLKMRYNSAFYTK